MPGIQGGDGRESETAHIFGIPIETVGLLNEQGGGEGWDLPKRAHPSFSHNCGLGAPPRGGRSLS